MRGFVVLTITQRVDIPNTKRKMEGRLMFPIGRPRIHIQFILS